MKPTADSHDDYGDELRSRTAQFRGYGARTAFEGGNATARRRDDVRRSVVPGEPGAGRVPVVDGGGSPHTALIGGTVAEPATGNGRAGIVRHGTVRDVDTRARVPTGVRASGSHPRGSRKDAVGETGMGGAFGAVTFTPGDPCLRRRGRHPRPGKALR